MTRAQAHAIVADPRADRAVRILAQYRLDNPQSRAESIVVIALNTSCRRSYRCIACGAEGGQHSAKWPQTVQSYNWCAHHTNLKCQLWVTLFVTALDPYDISTMVASLALAPDEAIDLGARIMAAGRRAKEQT